MRYPLLFCLTLLLASCSAKPCYFQAVAEQNQSVIHSKGIEGIAVDSDVRVVCLPSSTFVDLPTKKSMKKKKMLEFELQIYNDSDRTITFNPAHLAVVNGQGAQLTFVEPEQFKKVAKRKQIATAVSNVLGLFADSVSYGAGHNPQPYQQNTHILRGQEARASRQNYQSTVALIDKQYLKKHTLFPHTTYQGSFVVKPDSPGTDLVTLELYIPETHQRDQFTFALSVE